MSSEAETSSIYRETLLSYYEDEIKGEAYFYGLANHFDENEAFILLAKIERRAAEAIQPLLKKYSLIPKNESTLKLQGEGFVERHQAYTFSFFYFSLSVR